MKTDYWIRNVVTAALAAMCGIFFTMDVHAHDANHDILHAIEKGATAQLTIKVVDDEDKPVGDVKVEARFDAAVRVSGEVRSFITDTNGIAIVSGRTGKGISFRATKVDHYGANDEICYPSMGQGVQDGKWLPIGLERKIILRRIRNPVAKMPHISHPRYTTDTGKWIGFDIEKYDFIAPHGNGVYRDMEVKFDWDGKRGENFNGMDVTIRFTEPYSGAYYQNRIMMSDFKDTYFAVTNEVYQQEFRFYSHPIRNDRGEITKREHNFFNPAKSMIIRSRCIVKADGSLKQARYSEISDFTFGCSSKGVWIMFQPIYNPTPNDTNLEPKR